MSKYEYYSAWIVTEIPRILKKMDYEPEEIQEYIRSEEDWDESPVDMLMLQGIDIETEEDSVIKNMLVSYVKDNMKKLFGEHIPPWEYIKRQSGIGDNDEWQEVEYDDIDGWLIEYSTVYSERFGILYRYRLTDPEGELVWYDGSTVYRSKDDAYQAALKKIEQNKELQSKYNYGKKEKQSSTQLEMGQESEKEHKDVYKNIEKDVEDDGDLDLSFDEFTTDIAKDHLKEDSQYYTKLKEMEKKSKDDSSPLCPQCDAEIEMQPGFYDEEFEQPWYFCPECNYSEDDEDVQKRYSAKISDGIVNDFEEWKNKIRYIANRSGKGKSLRYISQGNFVVATISGDKELGLWNRDTNTGEYDEYENVKHSSFNTKTGIGEPIAVDPELESTLDFEEGQEIQEEPVTCTKIDTGQSPEQIKNQLAGEVTKCYPNRLTYDTIYETAVQCGLDQMDRYDLIGVLNSVALELGLPRIGWDAYFPSDEEVYTNNIQGIIGAPTYNQESTDLDEVSNLFDNEADKLFVLDRILDERIKMFMNYDDIVDQSTDIVVKSLSNIKKISCVPIKYYYQGIKEQETDRAGRLISGKVHYSVRLRNNENLKMERTIDLELPIKMARVEEPKTFKYNKEEYPLQTYYINDLF